MVMQGGRVVRPQGGNVLQGGRVMRPQGGMVLQGAWCCTPRGGIAMQGGHGSPRGAWCCTPRRAYPPPQRGLVVQKDMVIQGGVPPPGDMVPSGARLFQRETSIRF